MSIRFISNTDTSPNIIGTARRMREEFTVPSRILFLEDFSSNQGPDFKRIFLGCSVWDYHQFNREMLENSWLTLKASEDLIFDQKLLH